MNYKNLTIISVFLIIILMISCTDDSQHGPYGSDNIAPGPVVVENIYYRNFLKKDYLWPISQNEILRNPNLIQNPGW